MPSSAPLPKADSQLRLAMYRFIARRGHVPSARELAQTLSRREKAIKASLQSLADAHVIVLQRDTSQILRAAPFWAVPTAFQVQSGKHSWWGSCVWDALGIPAMLGRDARITTACGCCDSAMTLEVRKGRLAAARGVIHFAVPARHWYDNIVFT